MRRSSPSKSTRTCTAPVSAASPPPRAAGAFAALSAPSPFPSFASFAFSSSLRGGNGVGSSLRSTITYAPYVGSAWIELVFAHPEPSARSVLARKYRCRPSRSHAGARASAISSVMGVA